MKMKSAIRDMLSGKRGMYDKIKSSSDYIEARDKMFKVVDAFIEKLNEEQKDLFDNAYETIMDKSAENAIDHFTEGFKFGLLMGMEVASDSD